MSTMVRERANSGNTPILPNRRQSISMQTNVHYLPTYNIDYRFNFPSGPEWTEQVLAMGCGGIYNHSNTPNAYWHSNNKKRTFCFLALRDIEFGEEIFTFYGDESYWNDGRTHTEVK